MGLIEQREKGVPSPPFVARRAAPPPPQIVMDHIDMDASSDEKSPVETPRAFYEGDSNTASPTPGSSLSSLSSDGGATLLGISPTGSPLFAFSEWDPFLDDTFGEEYSNFSLPGQTPHQIGSPAESTEPDQRSRSSSTSTSTHESPSGKSSTHLSVSNGPTPLNLPYASPECFSASICGV